MLEDTDFGVCKERLSSLRTSPDSLANGDLSAWVGVAFGVAPRISETDLCRIAPEETLVVIRSGGDWAFPTTGADFLGAAISEGVDIIAVVCLFPAMGMESEVDGIPVSIRIGGRRLKVRSLEASPFIPENM